MRLHARGGVHMVTPQIVDELGLANHPGDHRSRVDADTDVDLVTGLFGNVSQDAHHALGEGEGDDSVIVPRLGDARSGHVAVADGLDLLQAKLLGEVVEAGEQIIEQCHQARGS